MNEEIETEIDIPITVEVELPEEVLTLVREYKAGKDISIEDGTINCTYEYVLPSNVVKDSSYVHTDNNFTTEEKTKLANLENADLTDYYTKSQTNNEIDNALEDYYTKQEIRTMIGQDLESYYTKEETNDEIDTALEDYYTKQQVDSNISNSVGHCYTKQEADSAVSTALGSYYNKTEVDTLIAGIHVASTASDVSITDLGNYFASNNVEGALQEIGAMLAGVANAVQVQSGVVQ